MSVSMYRSQVERLNKEIADLRGKLANEVKKQGEARSQAHRAADAASRATSQSNLRTRLRDVERHEKAIADHLKRGAALEAQIANKQKSLHTAQTNLERALQNQQKTEDRDAEKRRRTEITHLREMERRRRAAQVLPEELRARPTVIPAQAFAEVAAAPPTDFADEYDVCLSFAGEERSYVELVAAELKKHDVRVFYDQDDDVKANLWGKDLPEYLDYVYRKGSRVCLMFISAAYAAKEFTTLERRSALDRAMREHGEYILPVRIDDTELPGLRPGVAYIHASEYAPASLAQLVVQKIRGAPQEGRNGDR
jgi:hypothetical protein